MREHTWSDDTMALKGPVCDGSDQSTIYCDVWCAEDSGDVSEDSLCEGEVEPGDTCAFCGKAIPATATKIWRQGVEMHRRLDAQILQKNEEGEVP